MPLSMPGVQPPPLLLVGRLDGRLQNSPAADIWLARARIAGASAIAGIAGVPVTAEAITDWICGRTAPPRHSEGLNDPLSVAALVHFALSAQEHAPDPVARSTLRVLRTLLDDREEAELWAPDDLVRFGSAFRAAQEALQAPYPAPDLLAVAERLLEVQAGLSVASGQARSITTIDGRRLSIDPQHGGTTWLLACHLPRALVAAGITLRPIPTFVALPRLLTVPADRLARWLEQALGTAAARGIAELDRLERGAAGHEASALGVTRRSRLPELVRLQLAYPGVRVPAVARLLGISPQGAAKLVRRAAILSDRPKKPGISL